MTISRGGRIVLLGAVLAICGVLIVGAIDGRSVLEKVALRILTPVGLLWLALAGQAAWTLVRRRRCAAVWSCVLLAVLSLSGNGPIAGALLARIEQPYVDINPLTEPGYDALVVLGGGSTTGAAGRLQLNQSGDRLLLAAQMYHAGKTRRLICTGQQIKELALDGLDPAEQSQQILESLGVPRAAIELSGGRNTAEEFHHVAKILPPGERVGLLTSAWHMQRAQRLAQANGVQAAPVPADFKGSRPDAKQAAVGPGAVLLALIPSAEAMTATAMLWKEQLARLVGR